MSGEKMIGREQTPTLKNQVLVVDDEKRVAESIQFFLNKEGFDVSYACCGRDAVAFIKENRVELILLDISMPGMDGFEVLESIFHHDPDSLVVMMTGYATVESAVKALKLGAWDYLKKPFEYSELIKTVKNGITHKQLINENRAVSARLQISEMRCQYLVNNSPDLIYTLNARGKITFVNEEFEKVLGYRKEHLPGSWVQDIVHSDDCAKAVAAVNQVSSGSRSKTEVTIRLKRAGHDRKKY